MMHWPVIKSFISNSLHVPSTRLVPQNADGAYLFSRGPTLTHFHFSVADSADRLLRVWKL